VLVDRSALERAEGLMKASGLFCTDQIRPVIEARMWARWKLGQLLAKFQRGTGHVRCWWFVAEGRVRPDAVVVT
jgi:hypothetical protein